MHATPRTPMHGIRGRGKEGEGREMERKGRGKIKGKETEGRKGEGKGRRTKGREGGGTERERKEEKWKGKGKGWILCSCDFSSGKTLKVSMSLWLSRVTASLSLWSSRSVYSTVPSRESISDSWYLSVNADVRLSWSDNDTIRYEMLF